MYGLYVTLDVGLPDVHNAGSGEDQALQDNTDMSYVSLIHFKFCKCINVMIMEL